MPAMQRPECVGTDASQAQKQQDRQHKIDKMTDGIKTLCDMYNIDQDHRDDLAKWIDLIAHPLDEEVPFNWNDDDVKVQPHTQANSVSVYVIAGECVTRTHTHTQTPRQELYGSGQPQHLDAPEEAGDEESGPAIKHKVKVNNVVLTKPAADDNVRFQIFMVKGVCSIWHEESQKHHPGFKALPVVP